MSKPMLQEKTPPQGWTRRNFLVTTIGSFGGLCLGFSMSKHGMLEAATPAPSEYQINAYVRIGSDNHVTILFGGCEFGQGSMTGLAQIVAEELMVSWDQISIVQSDASVDATGRGVSYPLVIDPCTAKPVSIIYLTGGSSATRGRYNALRAAGATARAMLVNAGAQVMGVSPSQCSAIDGRVVVNGTQISKTFGELAAVAANPSFCPVSVTLTDPTNFRLIGESLARVDVPLKTNGSAVYGLDIRLPGMLYGVVKHCPTLGGTLANSPSVPRGARFVFPLKAELNRGAVIKGTVNAVAVLADNTWAALQAAKSLKAKWTIPASAASIDSQVIRAQAESLMQTGTGLIAEKNGNPDSELVGAIQKIDATYYLPYVPHVCMEVLNCTAKYTGTSCEVWAPTQSAAAVATTAKALTGLNGEQIKVHTTFLGGGLGRKFETDFVSQAIQAAMALYQKTGSAGIVKLMWPRDEDFTYDQFRPMALIRVQAGIKAGALSLKYRTVSPSIRQQRQADPTAPLKVADSLAVEGAAASNYGFYARQVEHVWHPAAVPVGYWRSVGHSINAFALESAIDELAFAASIDPLEIRRQLLAANTTNPKAARALAVVNAAAQLSPWRNSLPAGHAWGIAYEEAYGSLVCEIVDISQPAPGSIRVHRVACAVDCGVAINPVQIEAQMQGGIAHGLSAAFWGEQKFVAGKAVSRNFNAWRMLSAREMPQVEVAIVESGQQFVGGIGEPGVPPIAPAVANAYFRLTGIRLRNLPFFPNTGGFGDG